jgi:hypothetical protein
LHNSILLLLFVPQIFEYGCPLFSLGLSLDVELFCTEVKRQGHFGPSQSSKGNDHGLFHDYEPVCKFLDLQNKNFYF